MCVKERNWGNNQGVDFFLSCMYIMQWSGESSLKLPFIQIFIHKEFDHTLNF